MANTPYPVFPVSGTPPTGTQINTSAPSSGSSHSRNSGWYVMGACAVGIMFSGTKAAPVIFGILTVALIYQLTNLLEGK